MDQLRFTGLHEDGTHLVVTSTDGTDFVVAADERLRAALRQSAVQSAPRTTAATPREVQTHIRAGLSAEEVAETTGWTVDRVQRYEGPILAERAHVARLGSGCVVRTHDRGGPAPTLEARVRDRLQARGVNTDKVTWDSRRPDGGQWSIQVQFVAGQRMRHAWWSFDVAARSVEAIDDEARWLSEDEQSLPASAPAAAVFGAGVDGPDDLISSMRERSRRRGQTGGRRRKSAVTPEADERVASPIDGDQELPLEDLLTDSESASTSRSDTTDRAEPSGVEAFVAQASPADVSVSEEVVLAAEGSLERDEAEGDEAEGDEGEGDEDDSYEPDDALDDDGHTTLDDFFGIDDDDEEEQDDDVQDEEARDDEAQDDGDGSDDAHEGEATADVPAADASDSTQGQVKPSAPARGRKGRPSVPSWDDIMFGARDRKD